MHRTESIVNTILAVDHYAKNSIIGKAPNATKMKSMVATTFMYNAELIAKVVLERGKKLDHVLLMKVIKSMITDLEHIDIKASKFIKE
jgi:hypothetical protein